MATPGSTAGPVRAAGRPQRLRLGDILVAQKAVSPEQLKLALDEQKRSGRRLGRVLVEMEFVAEEEIARALSRQLNLAFVDLKQHHFNPGVVLKLPEVAARRFRAVVLEERGAKMLVGMADPTDLFAFDELTRILKKDVEPVVVTESEVTHALDRVYRRTEEISGLAKELQQDLGVDFGALDAALGAEDAPRLKLMAGLDISEKRHPQDGRFNVLVRQQPVDVRISTMPTHYGESVVMRLLNRQIGLLGLESLGMPDLILGRFREILHRVSGMVVVTGPTGSGKTTTLYAALSELNTPALKVITVEDPIEYRLAGLNQIQVNDKIDLTFATVLRSALRQDPDVMLIGEMRDTETAQIAMRAAITGHMVLSTLHVREAASAPMRLLDMGVPRYMVATALQAVIAQRLIRLICKSCGEDHSPTPQERRFVEAGWGGSGEGGYRKGKGCTQCNGSGYRGRSGVYEMLEMTPRLVEAAAKEDVGAFVRIAEEEMAGHRFVHHAAELVANGRTTLHEVMRISHSEE